MAVYRSPFSAQPNEPQEEPENPYKTSRKRIDARRQQISSGAVSLPSVPGDQKSSPSEEQAKTTKAYESAMVRILNANLPEKEKKKQIARLKATYQFGAEPGGGFVSNLGKAVVKIPMDILKVAETAFKPFQAGAKAIQVGSSEISDLLRSSMPEAAATITEGVINPLASIAETIERIPGLSTKEAKQAKKTEREADKGLRTKELMGKTVQDFKRQYSDPNWKMVNTGRKYVDNVIDFGYDVALDASTYLGAGAVNYAGKGGRVALTTKFATAEMRAKYPQIVLNDVMRYGAGAIPKAIREAEGISYGVKFAGQAIKGTDRLADVVAGKGGILSNARAATGDLIESSAALKGVRSKVAPSSRTGLLAIGAGRAGGKAATDEQIVQQVADLSSSKYAKGFKVESYDKNLAGIRDVVDQIDAQKLDRAEITRLVEDPVLRASAPRELADVAERIVDWQNTVREGVNEVYKKFGLDYGATLNEIGFVDNYVHHKLSSEGIEAVANPKYKAKGWFKDADLTETELGRTTGAAIYRKYRAGSEFMGQVLATGSIDEINEIFARVTNTPGAKFFDDDIVSLLDSYAYSMAAARGREAYIRRAMDFGGDIIKVVNKKTIPNAQLVSDLTAVHKQVVAARDALYKTIVGERSQAVEGVEKVIDNVQRILDSKGRNAAALGRRVDAAARQVAAAETRLIDAMNKAANMAEAERGAFLEAHGYLLEEVQRLKAAIETNTIEETLAYDEIRKVYMKVFPNAKRVPTNPTKALNAVKRAKGIAEPEELRELVRRRDAASAQIEELVEQGADDPQVMNDLLDIEAQLTDQITAFETLGEVRLAADYAEDGLLYGVWDDLSARQFDPNVDPRPYRTLDTRPIVRNMDDATTDEIMAVRQAFKEDPRSVVAHAIDNENIIDLREPENWYGFLDNEGPIGEAINTALVTHGVDSAPFIGAWNDLIQGGNFDPMFEQIYPEFAALIDQIGLTGAKVFPEGVVDDDYMVQVFDTISETMIEIARGTGVDNADEVGQSMFDTFIRGLVNDSGADVPVLFPSRVIYGANNPMADGAYSLVLPDSFGYVDGFNPGELLDHPSAPVRFAQGDQLVNDIMDGSLEQASWDVAQEMGVVAKQTTDAAERSAAYEAAKNEVRSIGRQIAGRKGTATKRIKEVEIAYDNYAKTGKFKVRIGDETKEMTREQALKALSVREKKINAELTKLQDRIATKTGRVLADKQTRIREQQARLAALMDEKKVLERWDDATGQALRDEIEFLQESVAIDPPRGYAGLQSRQWSDKVRKRMEAVRRLEKDAVPEHKAWSRLVTQMHAHEAQLAFMDMFDIPNIEAKLQAAKAGTYMGDIIDDVEDGWKIIQGMGVKVPDEVYEIMIPGIRQLKDPKNRNGFLEVVDFINATFKTYATLTPGFGVRNAISASFMNTAAGVTLANQKIGARAIRAYMKHGPMRVVDGVQMGWLKELGLPAEQWPLFEEALRATKATSRGLSSEMLAPTVRGRFGEFVLNNKVVRGEAKGFKYMGRRANDAIEMSVRFPMALDTLTRGANYDNAVARITRYHFDYDDVSELDEWAKRFVPFWIWTTRNIPLQMTEQLLRPQAYSVYNNLKERSEIGPDVVMPMWLANLNPIPLGGEWMLAPDLPMNRLDEQMKAFTDPKKLVGQLYPAFKLPVELGLADKQLSMDIPFTEKYEKAKGLDSLIAKLGEVTGQDWVSRRDPETGDLTINPRISYATGNLLPPVATAQRLSGGALGGKENYSERQLQSIANFLGIPLKTAEPYQRGELIGRQFKIRDLVNDLVRQGIIPKQD